MQGIMHNRFRSHVCRLLRCVGVPSRWLHDGREAQWRWHQYQGGRTCQQHDSGRFSSLQFAWTKGARDFAGAKLREESGMPVLGPSTHTTNVPRCQLH